MKLGSFLPDVAHHMDRLNHQSNIRAFETKLGLQSNPHKSFLHNFVKAAQGAASRLVNLAIQKPASTLVHTLLASQLVGVNGRYFGQPFFLPVTALPTLPPTLRPAAPFVTPFSKDTDAVAHAFEDCMRMHRHDEFPKAYEQVRCLGEMAKDICLDRDPGTSSRWNFDVKHDEANDAKHHVCVQLLGRAAGIHASISSADKTAEDILLDVVRDVVDHPYARQYVETDAIQIVDEYELRDEVDGSIIDSRDVSDWVSRYRAELERKELAHPPNLLEFIHAADNRYKESGEVKDNETYVRVLEGINKLDMSLYMDKYYGYLTEEIAKELQV